MKTTNQIVNNGDGWVKVASAISSGMFSVTTSCDFSVSDVGVPSDSLVGHDLQTSESTLYTLQAADSLYIKASNRNVIVIVTEN